MERRSMDTTTSQPARVPELIMRRPVPPVTSIVVGVDGSAAAAAAVRWAAAEACRRQVVLRILSAWDEPDWPGPAARAGDPALIAARRVQKALARVIGQPRFPRRIACATPRGHPGLALLTEAGRSGLLVLGMTGIGAAAAPGRVNRYCLWRARCPLVFVPAAHASWHQVTERR